MRPIIKPPFKNVPLEFVKLYGMGKKLLSVKQGGIPRSKNGNRKTIPRSMTCGVIVIDNKRDTATCERLHKRKV